LCRFILNKIKRNKPAQNVWPAALLPKSSICEATVFRFAENLETLRVSNLKICKEAFFALVAGSLPQKSPRPRRAGRRVRFEVGALPPVPRFNPQD